MQFHPLPEAGAAQGNVFKSYCTAKHIEVQFSTSYEVKTMDNRILYNCRAESGPDPRERGI
jgi:hypothetical protein